MTGLVLHNYFRSSTSIRLRVALNLKGIEYQYVAHHLRKGEHRSAGYLAINPQGLVPTLVTAEGDVLTQSMAIIEYLDELHPEPPLLPADAIGRARVRALANAIACEIHPVNNLRVLSYLKTAFAADDGATTAWFCHWVDATFAPLETMLAKDARTGRFCDGDKPGMADIVLYAQVINNRRFGVDMTPYPTITRIFEACAENASFARAAPERQPDTE